MELESEKNKLTKIVITHKIFSVLQMVYLGNSISDSCKEYNIPYISFYYARNQLFKFYKTTSLHVLLHKLVLEGIIEDE